MKSVLDCKSFELYRTQFRRQELTFILQVVYLANEVLHALVYRNSKGKATQFSVSVLCVMLC